MTKTTDFTQGDIKKPILYFALPIFLGNVLQQLYQIVNSIIVGRMLGAEALAAVSASTTIAMAVVIVMNGFAAGVAVLTAQLFGAKREKQVANLAYSTILVFSIICVVLSVVWIALSKPFLRVVMGTPESILAESASYFNIYIASLLFIFLYNIYSYMTRAFGNSRAPMYFLAIFSVVNVILVIIFVGPLKMGVFGAGLATFIAQGLSALLTMIYVSKHLPELHIFTRKVRFDKALFKDAVRIGVPNAVQQVLLAMSNIFLQKLVNSFGTITMAAQGVEYRVSIISSQIGNAFSRAISTFTGQNKGAQNFERIHKAQVFVLMISIGIGVVMTLLVCLFNVQIASMFVDYSADGASASKVVEQAAGLLSITAYSYVFMMVANMHLGLLRGAGDTLFTSAGTVTIVVVRIASAYLLAYFTKLGYLALGISMILMWTLAMVGMYCRYRSGKWKKAGVSLAEHFDDEEVL